VNSRQITGGASSAFCSVRGKATTADAEHRITYEYVAGLHRRRFLGSAILAAAGYAMLPCETTRAERDRTLRLFDGETLDGWIQVENSTTSFSGSDISDLTALAKSILEKTNGVAAFLNGSFDDPTRNALTDYPSSHAIDPKTARSTLAKALNAIISGPLVYDKARFQGVTLRPETRKLLRRNLQGRELVELNRMLLTDAFPSELAAVSPGWSVKDGAMASTGSGRGVIYTARDFRRFRLTFTMRHVSGNPDHQACVLIFCTRPTPDEIPLDALGGIQFQVPRGGQWDYRPRRNNAGGNEFTLVTKVSYDPHEWSRVEIVADATAGTARMAVAQPVGGKAVEVLDFHDPVAGRVGPIAWQMHNAGLFDEYKDVSIETNPSSIELMTVK
jgi:3-keto-disaccharide hydrolase